MCLLYLGSITSCLLYLGSIICNTKVKDFAVCQDAATEYWHRNACFGLLFFATVASVIQYHCSISSRKLK